MYLKKKLYCDFQEYVYVKLNYIFDENVKNVYVQIFK